MISAVICVLLRGFWHLLKQWVITRLRRFVTSVHLPFSVRLLDLFVASLVFMKSTSCCVIRRNFKKSWAVIPCYGKFLEVISPHDFRCYLRELLRGFWHLRKQCGKQWLGLSESTELIYFPSYLFLQRRCSFTSRKLYTSLSCEILIFLSAIWSSLCFSSLM